jgi:hypothetical protein
MAKGPMYVKDFNFSSAGKTVGRCNDSMTKMASGGYYSKGGITEAATGETYPSRRAMMKHESLETPRMQRDEVMQSRTVKAPPVAMAAARQGPPTPMRRQMPVAPTGPMIQPGAMKKGGFVKGGEGMIKSSGTLGIKGNKNPGEKNGKPTTATKTGNVRFKKGGEVKKYADGGPATQTGALNQMAAQQKLTPSQIARQQAMAAQAAGKPMSQAQQQAGLQQAMTASQQPGYNPNMQQQNLSGAPLGQLGQQLTPSQIARQQAMAAQAAGKPMSQAQQQANLQSAMSGQQAMDQYRQTQYQGLAMPGGQQPTQTMLAGSQPMPPGMTGLQAQPMSPPQQLQSLAQMAQQQFAGQGMPGGQQGPVGLGQPLGGAPAGAMPPPGYGFGNPQNAPPQSFYNGIPSAPSPQMASYAQQGLGRLGQGMGQPLGGPQPMPTQQGMQQQYNPFQQGQSGQMGQALPQQGTPQQAQMGIGLGQALPQQSMQQPSMGMQSQSNGGGIGQYGGAVGQMGMGMGKFP